MYLLLGWGREQIGEKKHPGSLGLREFRNNLCKNSQIEINQSIIVSVFVDPFIQQAARKRISMKSLLNRLFCLASLVALTAGAAHAQVTVPPGGVIDVPLGGTMNLGCNALLVQGNFNVNAGQVTSAGEVSISTGGIVDGGTGSVTVSGNWSNSGSFLPGTGTVTFTDGCTTANVVIAGQTTFNNLSLTSTNGRTFVIPSGANVTVNGTLTLQGANGQPITLISSAGQTAVISLGPQATVVRNNVNVNSNVQIGAAPAAGTQSIPTLSEYAMITLALLMLLVAYRQNKRGVFNTVRKQQSP